MYNLSVCSVVRNESLYFAEYIEFNLLQGVEHFFIYYNPSPDGKNDNTLEIAKHYEKLGVVTLETIEVNPCQFVAYNKCLKDHGSKTRWCAFLDFDEYLYSPTLNGLQKAIEHVAHKSKIPVGAIGAHWIFYGSNGHKCYSDGLVIERFDKRARTVDKHVKSIVRPDCALSVGKNPHYFVLKPGYIAIEENGKKLPESYAITEGGTANVLRISHFHTKSYDEYVKRKTENPDPGHGRFPDRARIDVQFEAFNLNEILDMSLKRYVKQVKQNIKDRGF